MEIADRPIDNSPLRLFEFAVKRVKALKMMSESKTHQAWANLIFSYEKNAFVRSELMSRIKNEYPAYFDRELNYSFVEEKIRNNFPYLFGSKEDKDLFGQMLKALDAECTEQKNPRNRKTFRVISCDQLSSQDGQIIYKAKLLVEDGDDPHFSEGMPIELRSAGAFYTCEVVEFDYENAFLFFSSKRPVFINNDTRVISDATMNTVALMNLLQEISMQKIAETIPLHKFLNHTTHNLKKITYGPYPPYLDDMLSLDESQMEAFQAALGNDITFIWGPPGTGKSYTLAAIIMALHKMNNERTAVCCLSNVAVDQLLLKVVDIIGQREPNMPRGQFYRAGRTQDSTLVATDYLFPDDEKARMIRLRIKQYSLKIEKYRKNNEQFSDEAIKIKAKLKDEREKLKEHTDFLISQVRVVFSTIANFVLNTRLKNSYFDNLIIDEASMLAQPQLIALASKVTKRIILVGDFQQLSPITVAGIPILKDSVFKICGIDINHTGHPALHQLLNQRRSNPKLVDIINHSFYDDRLHAVNNRYNPIVARAPYSECVIGMKCVSEGMVRFTKGGTRQNVANAKTVIELVDLYSKDKEQTFSIGVITPYTGQVALLKALFIKRAYDLDFQDRVKIGTVHTFQGSECDVIIFDMVDCLNMESGAAFFGKIYAGEQGEQLLNVAISRARHKLIIVCEPELLNKAPGGKISDKSKIIFNNLLKARFTKE